MLNRFFIRTLFLYCISYQSISTFNYSPQFAKLLFKKYILYMYISLPGCHKEVKEMLKAAVEVVAHIRNVAKVYKII